MFRPRITDGLMVLVMAATISALLPISTKTDVPTAIKAEEFRLPTTFTPEYYKLDVITHLDDADGFKFSGNVRITINCHEDTNRITLHSRSLQIDEPKVTLSKVTAKDTKTTVTQNIAVTGIEYEDDLEFLIIQAAETLTKGSVYELYIAFEAPLENRLHGYYLSSYDDKKTQQRQYLSVTQFESTYARFAFPCFDEPAMKANFEISLAHHNKFIALSNMPIRATEQFTGKDNWVVDHFEKTVPMSTYLVAYSVNSFEYREALVELDTNVVFRIYARPDAIDQVEYARLVGPKVLKYFENYFDTKFPLPKMDMIALPDFSSGAMENWGLVTYREKYLLYSPERSSTSNQQAVASVIAHELAHQWFGNLVTMKWWDDLWLNEGFATYVASLGVQHLHPEWNSFDEESLHNTQTIFRFDAMRSSHPVKVEISNPATLFQIFDEISYKKGSSIIRMMHRFLGEKAFRMGVHNYLQKHKYENAEQDNLWDSLTEEAHLQNSLPKDITVKQIMDKWTLQTGYPTITVNRDYEKKTAILTQRRTFAKTLREVSPDEEHCWWIPLSYTNSHDLDFNASSAKDWMSCADTANRSEIIPKTMDNQPDENSWILYNIDMSGLYKVQYDTRNWELLIEQLAGPDFKQISTLNRAQLAEDSLGLAWAGEQNYSIALRLVDFLRKEDEYIPWSAALSNLDKVRSQLKRTPKYGLFQEYMRRILSPAFQRLGGLNVDRKVGDRQDVIKHKVQISAQSCRYDVANCNSRALEYFQQWMDLPDPDANNPIPVDLRTLIYCAAIRNGGLAQWDFLWARYQKSNVASERESYLLALSYSREVWLLSRFLDYSVNETLGIRSQDTSTVFTHVVANDVGFFLAKTFFEQNVQLIHDKMAPETSRLSRYIKAMAGQMKTLEEMNELKAFVDERKAIFSQSLKGVDQALETIEISYLWHRNNYEGIGQYLQEFSQMN